MARTSRSHVSSASHLLLLLTPVHIPASLLHTSRDSTRPPQPVAPVPLVASPMPAARLCSLAQTRAAHECTLLTTHSSRMRVQRLSRSVRVRADGTAVHEDNGLGDAGVQQLACARRGQTTSLSRIRSAFWLRLNKVTQERASCDPWLGSIDAATPTGRRMHFCLQTLARAGRARRGAEPGTARPLRLASAALAADPLASLRTTTSLSPFESPAPIHLASATCTSLLLQQAAASAPLRCAPAVSLPSTRPHSRQHVRQRRRQQQGRAHGSVA
jgi:hypothetical protein